MKLASMVAFCFVMLSSNLWGKDFSVMTYNLENLFDTTHDEGKEDWTYLPLKFKRRSQEVQEYCRSLSNDYYRKSCFNYDWNESVLSKKMQNLAEVIKEYDKGAGADIIVFAEVENIKVLTALFETHLSGLGYQKPVLIEGPDERGIDVAIVSKFILIDQKYHNIDLSRMSRGKTRGILEATFQVEDSKVTVFANHWPSQGNPDSHRLEAAKTLRTATEALPNEHIALALGDFNTLHDDYPHGINTHITSNKVPVPYEDLTLSKQARAKGLEGTHWYRGEWSMLDRIFLLKRSMKKQVEVRWDSLEIIKKPYMVHSFTYRDYQTGRRIEAVDVPKRFNTDTGEGYSDHLPVAVTITLK